MSKIPTAEEFFDSVVGYTHTEMCERAIEFAKLHVEAALKACIEDAPSGSSTDTVSYEDVVEALKDSYPLTNIK